MAKKPWFKFFAHDWLSDRNLRRCSHAAQDVWIAMLCLMDDCTERGYLIEDGIPWLDDDVAAAVGGDKASALACIQELCAKSVVQRDTRGALYSRRMCRDSQLSQVRSEAGNKGALASAKSRQTLQQKSRPPPSKPLTSDSELWDLVSEILTPEFRESADFKKSWTEWAQYRRAKGKPISKFAAKAQAKKIVEDFGSVERAIAAISHSIAGDYQGLFEPAGRNAPHSSGQSRPAEAASPARIRGTVTGNEKLNIVRPTS